MKPPLEFRPSRVPTPKLREAVKRERSFGSHEINPPILGTLAQVEQNAVPIGPGMIHVAYPTDAQAELARRRKLKAEQMKRYRAKRKARDGVV